MARRSIEITSFAHSNPIPAASRVGPLLISSIIAPRDPAKESVPDSADAQLDNLFHHVGEILKESGADWTHIVRMTFYVPDGSYRDLINRPWVQRFPDAGSRPARYTNVNPGGGKIVTCEFTAYIE
jgi:2-iminobutanoate/2-iminopropanoate deaminase